MSEITLFKAGNAVIPAYIKNVESKLKDLTFAGASGRTISIKGGVWRMIVDGKEVAHSEERAIKVVIVGMSEVVGRVHYPGSYEEGVSTPPNCWSADGKTPDPRSEAPQATSCDNCPKNIGGSGQGDTKACRYIRNLAVVFADDINGDIYKLSLPATSLFGAAEGKNMPLDAYRRLLKGNGIPIDCVITEMRFDTSVANPKVVFSAVECLEEHEFYICQEKAKSEEATKAAIIEFSAGTKPSKTAQVTAQPVFETPKTEAPALPSAFKKAPVVEPAVVVEEVDGQEAQPKRRASKKEAPVVSAPSVSDVLAKWADDDDDQD